MESNKVFTYQYSAKQNREVENIRRKYLPKEENKIETLRRLDANVKLPANVFAYVFGSVSAIIMGAGMSLVMTDIGQIIGMESAMLPGVVIGIIGMIMALLNYPMYKGIFEKRKKRYSAEILKLSEKIIND